MNKGLLAGGRPRQRSDVCLRSAGAEHSVFDPRNDQLHLLNESALAIWQLCDGDTAPEEMVEAICTLCSLPLDVAKEDVERTLTEFDNAGLIEWSTPK